ncbi:MAG TPA: carboxyl transferase domain-containing protein, partial [Planctomycetaceae bacterium]|nr:carboxyl transferase domain-containing protein [Planctomycetaceae bacterium]
MAPQFQLPFEKPIYELEDQLEKLEGQPSPPPTTLDAIRNMRAEIQRMKRDVFDHLDAWETVKVARHPDRPQARDYIELMFDDFLELHGDRAFGDDRAIVTGFARLDGQKVMVVGQQKGKTLKERESCYYGCAHPEGYRKALQKMELAAKHGVPIVCLIDTPGAYPGIGAEERGQAYAIAVN